MSPFSLQARDILRQEKNRRPKWINEFITEHDGKGLGREGDRSGFEYR